MELPIEPSLRDIKKQNLLAFSGMKLGLGFYQDVAECALQFDNLRMVRRGPWWKIAGKQPRGDPTAIGPNPLHGVAGGFESWPSGRTL